MKIMLVNTPLHQKIIITSCENKVLVHVQSPDFSFIMTFEKENSFLRKCLFTFFELKFEYFSHFRENYNWLLRLKVVNRNNLLTLSLNWFYLFQIMSKYVHNSVKTCCKDLILCCSYYCYGTFVSTFNSVLALWSFISHGESIKIASRASNIAFSIWSKG